MFSFDVFCPHDSGNCSCACEPLRSSTQNHANTPSFVVPFQDTNMSQKYQAALVCASARGFFASCVPAFVNDWRILMYTQYKSIYLIIWSSQINWSHHISPIQSGSGGSHKGSRHWLLHHIHRGRHRCSTHRWHSGRWDTLRLSSTMVHRTGMCSMRQNECVCVVHV